MQVIGHSSCDIIAEPVKIDVESTAVKIGVNNDYNSYCILHDGRVMMWGKGFFGRFDFMREGDEVTATKVFPDRRVQDISFGEKHVIALCTT
jgi:hypothetical protein